MKQATDYAGDTATDSERKTRMLIMRREGQSRKKQTRQSLAGRTRNSFFFWSSSKSPVYSLALLSLLLLSLKKNQYSCHATHVPCSTDSDCVAALKFSHAQCSKTAAQQQSQDNVQQQGYCVNPYQSGCLQAHRPQHYGQRVCNSDDPPQARGVICAASDGNGRNTAETDDETHVDNIHHHGLDYPEVRIGVQNWESPHLEAWILQILLSEVLHVPTTVETGIVSQPHVMEEEDGHVVTTQRTSNFYDPTSHIEYGGIAYDYDGLRRAAQAQGDCTQYNNHNNSSSYQSCSHALLEIWSGHEHNMNQIVQEGAAEPPAFIGLIGQEGWLVPKRTAEQDPSLVSHYGLRGQNNRLKLAQRFRRPTTWGDYCRQVVTPAECDRGTSVPLMHPHTNQTYQQTIATRAPQTDEEAERYFVDGLYYGHFRYTEENNCTKWPKNCTGHFLDYPCGWSSFFMLQAHHLNIGLSSSGKEPHSGGYDYPRAVEIWTAANWTQSDIIGWWWRPEALYQQFQGTDFELQPVAMPPVNHECLANRPPAADRCSADPELQVGKSEGTCDVPPIPNYKLLSTGLYDLVHNADIPEGRRSPAYEVVKQFTVNGEMMGRIFDYWRSKQVDPYGFDPRDAVCRWVTENLEEVLRLVPRSYPRTLHEKQGNVLNDIAVGLGVFSACSSVVAAIVTCRHRHQRAFRFAQVEFVYLLLFGVLLVSIAATLTALHPSNKRCVSIVWFLNVGYCFELCPIIVKIAAINRLMSAAKRMKRIKLDRKYLFGIVAILTICVMSYQMLWTLLDPPRKEGDYTLTDKQTEDGRTIVDVSYFCCSSSRIWMYISLSVQSFLLLCSSILAFLTRKTRSDINETRTISILIYWNFIIVMLRTILELLDNSTDQMMVTRSLSIILSTDSLVTLLVYFTPKVFNYSWLDGEDSAMTLGSSVRVSFGGGKLWDGSGPGSSSFRNVSNCLVEETDPHEEPKKEHDPQTASRTSSGRDLPSDHSAIAQFESAAEELEFPNIQDC